MASSCPLKVVSVVNQQLQQQHKQHIASSLLTGGHDQQLKVQQQQHDLKDVISSNNEANFFADEVKNKILYLTNGKIQINHNGDNSSGFIRDSNCETSMMHDEQPVAAAAVSPLLDGNVGCYNETGCFNANDNAKVAFEDFELGPFEGVEKRFIIEFYPSVLNSSYLLKGGSLRSLSPSQFQLMLDKAACQILSHRVLETPNGSCTGYLLSESSLFVYDHSIILKTCGTTTPLLALPVLLNLVTGILNHHQCDRNDSNTKRNVLHNPPPLLHCVAKDSFDDFVSVASSCSTTETTTADSLSTLSSGCSTSSADEHQAKPCLSKQQQQQLVLRSSLFGLHRDKQQDADYHLLNNHVICYDEGQQAIDESSFNTNSSSNNNSSNTSPLTLRCLSYDSLNSSSTTEEPFESFNVDLYQEQQQRHYETILSTDDDEEKSDLVLYSHPNREMNNQSTVVAVKGEVGKIEKINKSTSTISTAASTITDLTEAVAAAITIGDNAVAQVAADTRCEYVYETEAEIMRLISSEAQKSIKWMIFCHLSYCFPDKQKYPHRSHKEETEYLDRLLFPFDKDGNNQQQQEEGQKEQQRNVFSLKTSEDRELFVYAFMNADGDGSCPIVYDSLPAVVISEMIMLQIDENCVDSFAGKGSGYNGICEASQRRSAIQRMMKDSQRLIMRASSSDCNFANSNNGNNNSSSRRKKKELLIRRVTDDEPDDGGGYEEELTDYNNHSSCVLDQFWFSPYGYSCNLLVDNNSEYNKTLSSSASVNASSSFIGNPCYVTAHISPESGSSYASLEASYSFNLKSGSGNNYEMENVENDDCCESDYYSNDGDCNSLGTTLIIDNNYQQMITSNNDRCRISPSSLSSVESSLMTLDYSDALSTFNPYELHLVEFHLWGIKEENEGTVLHYQTDDSTMAAATIATTTAVDSSCKNFCGLDDHMSVSCSKQPFLGGRPELHSTVAATVANSSVDNVVKCRYALVDIKEQKSSWFCIKHSEYRRIV